MKETKKQIKAQAINECAKPQNPSMLSALERGFVDNIISTLEFIEKDKMICYADEIEFLKKIQTW